MFSSGSSLLGFLKSYDAGDHYVYYLGDSSEVLSSSSLSSWNSIISIGSFEDACMNSFEMLNPYVVLASNISGEHAGLYYTFYNYRIEDNTSPFTAESAYYAYYSNVSATSEIYYNAMSAHISEHHLAPDSEMALINSYMDTDF